MGAVHRPQDCNSLSYGVTGLSCSVSFYFFHNTAGLIGLCSMFSEIWIEWVKEKILLWLAGWTIFKISLAFALWGLRLYLMRNSSIVLLYSQADLLDLTSHRFL